MVVRVVKAGEAGQSVRRAKRKPRVPKGATSKTPRRAPPPSPSWIKPLSFEAVAPSAAKVEPTVVLQSSGVPSLAWHPQPDRDVQMLRPDDALGRHVALPGDQLGDMIEVVMGLDFGTSCSKVVITDRSAGVSHAIPFFDQLGVAAYLMPSQLGEQNGVFALSHEGISHADLKLAMLADISDELRCARVCAYLALLIRSARAWLFATHHAAYAGKDLVWSLALGQPADQSASRSSKAHFERLGAVSWWLASSSGNMSVERCMEAWQSAPLEEQDLDVMVMPELAAQIHGFVSSSHFDVRAKNFYLMVDVGAGTVDASMFRVHKRKGGQVSFDLITNSVEALGAANLHRHRVSWWLRQIQGLHGYDVLSEELRAVKMQTEFRGAYPASFRQYVDNVSVSFSGGAKGPDDEFGLRVRNQVVGRVYYRAGISELMPRSDLLGLPYFLCGGGSKHPLYAALAPQIEHTEGCTWLKGKYRELSVPEGLRAPGLLEGDYHRLSVAFGLSRLDIGTVEQVGQYVPAIPLHAETSWTAHYVSKDAC